MNGVTAGKWMEGTIMVLGRMDGMEASTDRKSHTVMLLGRSTRLQNRSLIVLIKG